MLCGSCRGGASRQQQRRMRRQERRKRGSSSFVSSSVESKYLKEDVCIAPEGAESREGGEKDEAKTLYCLETGERIPSDAYSRRGHYITCCWGNCSTQSNDEDRSEDQEKQANTDISQCCEEAKCTCADGQSTDEYSEDERQSQFPFVNRQCCNSVTINGRSGTQKTTVGARVVPNAAHI